MFLRLITNTITWIILILGKNLERTKRLVIIYYRPMRRRVGMGRVSPLYTLLATNDPPSDSPKNQIIPPPKENNPHPSPGGK